MKTTKTFQKRILSIALSIALLLSVVPFGAFSVAAASAEYYDRVADVSTMDNWQKYFDLESLDTVNAGGVWTDKSVFTDTSLFPNSVTMKDGDRNFLTALSAIAANKEIVGYSSIPTDTVLVLDLSGSMTNAQAEDDLVDAANDAITRLLAVNENNRVGVVLYSASSTTGTSTYSESVTRLLPIDRYTTAADGKYLNLRYEEMEFNNNERDYGIVSVDEDVVGAKTAANALTKEKVFVGGTYIQAGLWEAKEMFEEMDTQIGDNNWQSGDDRMPILVLMSDGAPSTGTSYYDDVKNSQYTTGSGWNQRTVYESNVGNGSETGLLAGNAFLTQLTASYVMNRIETHYQQKDANVRGLFYTLGFNIGENSLAQSVMNPDASTATDTLWATYNSLTGGSMSVNVRGRNGNNTNVSIAKNSYATSKSYVDQYFSAAEDGLSSAFDAIVEEIILQSRYYPTHLAGGNPDFSGYVEFTDELGEYMEVKHVNGILLGNTLFDGHMMASKLADNSEDGLGTPARPTALGDEFIRAVKTRLGIAETADAQALVAKAYADKQLYYTDANNWSNYIAWYAKADGTYAGFYDEDGTEAKPADAVYINRSYGFLGETVGSIKNSDMMYMSVQVRTNIETGKQTVLWKIPASLVPMVTYKVSLTGTNVDTATNVQLTLADENVAPIRLVYETGLRSDLNAFNITRITETEADAKSDEAHVADDGYTRLFWNNAYDIAAADHEHHKTAMAEFTPNKENERFYYTFDSAVHKKVGNDYVLVDDSEPLDGNGKLNKNGEYYHRRYTFKEDVLTPIFTYEKMSAASIQEAVWKPNFETLEGDDVGAWVVAEGTPARELKMYSEEKATNVTDSAHMIFYPYLTEQNSTYYVDMNLGNNGLLAVTPAQGIKLSKTIDVYENGTSTDFAFRVTVHNANGTPYTGSADSYVTALDVTPSGTPTAVIFSAQGTHVFDLAANETLWLAGLPTGATYTVEEVSANSDYKVKSVHVNGQATGNIAAGTVAAYYIDDVDFVNTVIGEGHLVITKQVVDTNGNSVDIADSVTFTAEVTLTDATGAPVSGTFDSSNGNLTVPANGKFTVTLKEGESFIVRNIPEETRYAVSETNIPNGFALDTAKSVLNGVVDASANDQALIVNTYEPTDATGQGVQVKVTKQITGNRTDWVAGESYTFRLERLGNNAAVLGTATVAAGDTVKEHLFSLTNEVYETAGTYYYRLTEEVGTQGGITYDTAERRFSVEVADTDMNGTLEIVAVNNEMNTAVSGSWLVTADFNNVYAPTGSATATVNIQKTMNGNAPLSGYRFALYETDPAVDADAEALLTSVPTDAAGTTVMRLTYSAADVGNTYTYYLAEVGRGELINNVQYDDTVYKVEVTVTDNLDGTISAATDITNLPAGATAPVFENEYVPSDSDYVTLSGRKTIRGDRVLNAGEFEFKLTAKTANAPMPAGALLSTEMVVRNASNGSFSFGAIEFKDEHKGNTYEYTVTEVNTDPIGGFTYDGTVYTVTVTVTDNGDRTITASTVINNGAVTDIVFTNEYDATDAQVTLTATKMLTGKPMTDGEFTFRIAAVTDGAPMPASATATNDANGNIAFGTITYERAGTYVYTIAEVDGGDDRYDYDKSVYTVTVTVTDNSVGTLSARVTLTKNNMPATAVVFQNGFTPAPILYDIHTDFGGEKFLDGRPLEEGEFEFALINALNGEQIGDTVKNAADGTFRFPAVTIAAAGVYHFKITEVVGTEKGVSYDTSSFHIRVVVEQDDNGVLSVTNKRLYKGTVEKQEVGGVLTEVTNYTQLTDTDAVIRFNNTYKAEPVYVTLEATKVLLGRDLKDGEFKFDLYKTDDTFAIENLTPVQDDVTLVLNNDGKGDVTFMAEMFDTAGTYYYVIVEDELDEKGVTADKTAYKVEVEVTDNHQGNLVAALKVNGQAVNGALADTITFENVYKAAATEIVISGEKTLNGRELQAEEFSFELYDESGAKVETVKNAADGKFAFTAIPIDTAGEYVYTVRELAGDAENVTYDEAVYTVKAVVTDNLDGTFSVAYTYLKGTVAAEGVTFVNIYTAPPAPTPEPTPEPTPTPEPVPEPEIPTVQTGDTAQYGWLAALLFVGGGGMLFSFKKKRKEDENA